MSASANLYRLTWLNAVIRVEYLSLIFMYNIVYVCIYIITPKVPHCAFVTFLSVKLRCAAIRHKPHSVATLLYHRTHMRNMHVFLNK